MSAALQAHSTGVPRRLVVGCALPLLVSAAWALWPVRAVDVGESSPEIPTASARSSTTLAALDLDAFRAPIWIAPPPPPTPPAPEKPAAPIKFQLLAIVREDNVYKAALYDPDADKILVVAAGESLGNARVVESVTADRVALRDARGLRTLALREDLAP